MLRHYFSAQIIFFFDRIPFLNLHDIKSIFNFGGKMIKSFFKFSAILSLFITSTVSLAQVALEEMVVTSQKREQNLLDVPSALQAFSGDMLEDAGLRDTNDLINMVPDMLMSGEDSGRANIWLRGIGSTKFDIGSEGSNAFFVDEVYMSRNQSILTGLVDLKE